MTPSRRLVSVHVLVVAMLVVATPARAQRTGDPDLDAAARLAARQRWAAVDSLAGAALARADHATPPNTANAARALELMVLGRVEQRIASDTMAVEWARRLLALREAQRPRDTLALADAEALLGRLLGIMEDFKPGLAHLARALELRDAARPDDDSLIAETRLSIGALQRRQLDLPAAEKTLSEAIAAYGRGGTRRDVLMGTLHVELAGALTWMDRADDARRAYLVALDCYRSRLGPEAGALGLIYDGLSQLEKNVGDMGRSLDWLERAVEVKTRAYGPEFRSTLISRTNLGSRLIEFRDYVAARRTLEPVVGPLEKHYGPGHSVTEQARTNLAIACLSNGDTATARRLLETSLVALRARPGDHQAELAWALKWLAQTLDQEGGLAAARDTNQRALEIAHGLEIGEQSMLVDLRVQQLDLLARIGDLAAMPAAIDALDTLVTLQGLAGTQADAGARAAQARAEARLGARARAWTTAIASEALSRRLMEANAAVLPDRQALGLSEEWTEALPILARLALGGPPGDATIAWDRAQRWHGWRDRERELRRPPRAGSDSAVVGSHERWVAAERRYARLVIERAGSMADSAARDTVDQARAAAERAESYYRAAVSRAGGDDHPSQPSLADVLAHLGPDEALVSYALASVGLDDPGHLVAFVARGGGAPSIVDLGPANDARATLAAWRERLSEPPGPNAPEAERACREAGLTVRRRLWDALARWTANARVVHVVDGALESVPWLALPVGARAYLAERGPEVRVHESERDVMLPDPARTPERALAIGGPDFDRAAHEAAGTPVVTALYRAGLDPCTPFPVLGPLPAAGTEAREIAAILAPGSDAGWPHVRTGDEADETTFRREAPGCTVLHLATHGVVMSDTCGAAEPGLRGVGGIEAVDAPRPKPRATPVPGRPAVLHTGVPSGPSPWIGRRVWLALAGANHAREALGDENEGMLTAEEVVTLDLRAADWVVLSACHSGATRAWTDAGALGMTHAFRLAGARTVIASRWSLEDESAREWMKALYAARARGVRRGSEAVAEACRAVLAARRADGRTTHPFYWAAFSAAGD